MNNPFGLPDDLFGAILASAIAEGMNPANNRTMKKPNPKASKQKKQCVPSFYCCKYMWKNCYGRLAREMFFGKFGCERILFYTD